MGTEICPFCRMLRKLKRFSGREKKTASHKGKRSVKNVQVRKAYFSFSSVIL